MATHSIILACRIPWTEEPGQLQSMELRELDTLQRSIVDLQCRVSFRCTAKYCVDVESLSYVQLFVTSRTPACQGPLSSTVPQSFPKFMSIDSVMLSNHLIHCHRPLLLPSIFPSHQDHFQRVESTHTHTYTHTYIILFIFFSIICYYKILSIVPHVIHTYIFFFFLFLILFHQSLLQNIEYSSLCYRVGSCCFLFYVWQCASVGLPWWLKW